MKRNPKDEYIGRQLFLFSPAFPTEGLVSRRRPDGNYEVVLDRVIQSGGRVSNITVLPAEVLEAFLILNEYYRPGYTK